MSDFNKVFILGRIVRNPEIKTTSEGLFISHFTIANNLSKKEKDGSWSEQAHFFDFALFGKRAESISQYLIKGQLVAVEGHLIQRRWEKDGKVFSRIEISVDDIKLISRPGNTKTENLKPAEESPDNFEDEPQNFVSENTEVFDPPSFDIF